MSQKRNEPPSLNKSFLPSEFVLILKRFSNLKHREKIYLIESVAGVNEELLESFLEDCERILLRERNNV